MGVFCYRGAILYWYRACASFLVGTVLFGDFRCFWMWRGLSGGRDSCSGSAGGVGGGGLFYFCFLVLSWVGALSRGEFLRFADLYDFLGDGYCDGDRAGRQIISYSSGSRRLGIDQCE